MSGLNIYKYLCPLLLASIFLIPNISHAASYYVDFTSGTDSADCTGSSSPCQTFGAAGLSGVTAGDYVNTTGTYNSGVGTDITVAWNGSSGSPITIQAWDGESQPVIDGSSGFSVFAINFTGSYVTFDGFEVKGVDEDISDIAVKLTSADNIVISNNTIHSIVNTNVYGIYDSASSHTSLLNNTIYDVYSNYFASSTGDLLINGNIIYDKDYDGTYGIAINANSTASLLIINNFFYDTTSGIYLFNISGLEIYNNSFYNHTNCVYANTASGTNYLKNNIFHTSAIAAIGDYSGSNAYLDNVVSDNNIFYEPTLVAKGTSNYSTLAIWQTYSSEDANSSEEDPKYVSTESGSEDLHLQSTSPAIDEGADESAYFTDDIDDETRPYNSIFDIGADERPLPATPAAPTGSNVTPTTADISWSAPSTTVNSYTLQYDTDSDFSNPTTVDNITDASYTVSELEASTLYYFKVKGTYTTSYSSYTGSYSSSGMVLTTPYTPVVSNIRPKKAAVSWDTDTTTSQELPEIRYIVEVADNLNYSNSTIAEGIVGQNYTLSELKTSKKQYVRVKAISANNESEWSATESFRTLPRKGKIKKIVKKDFTTLSLRLRKVYRIDEYKAKVWYKKGKTWKKLKVYTKTKKLKKTTPKMKISNLEPRKTYKIKVWCKKGSKIGPKSVLKTTQL